MDKVKGLISKVKDFFTIYYIKHNDKLILQFETLTEANFSASSEVCGYPTERGAFVIDYVYANPSELEIVGVISKNSFLAVFGYSTGKLLGLPSKDELIALIDKQLAEYIKGIYKLDIKTKSALRTGYTLTKYNIAENLDNFGTFNVTMSFVEVLDANIERKKVKNPKNAKDTDTVDTGKTTLKN
jgi:hypothetical protein